MHISQLKRSDLTDIIAAQPAEAGCAVGSLWLPEVRPVRFGCISRWGTGSFWLVFPAALELWQVRAVRPAGALIVRERHKVVLSRFTW